MEQKIPLKEEYLAEKYYKKEELPKHIRLDASTVCQLHCPSCYMRKDKEGVKNGCKVGHLKFENFKKLVDDNSFESIELSNSGEIFLNPELVKMIEYAHQKGIRLTADNGVNLNYLTEEQAEALVKYEFFSITISLDGASEETYSKYRIGGSYNKVLENIEKIIKYKKKYKSQYPFLDWKFIVFGHNEHEIEKVKKYAKEIGMDNLLYVTNWDKDYSPIRDVEYVKRETGIDALNLNTSPVIHLKEYLEGHIEWYYCSDLWEPQINWDGQILGCCANYRSNFGGNAFEEGLLNALNNPKMIYAKNMVTNNAPPIEGIPCSDCWIYKEMKAANFWLKSPKIEGKREIITSSITGKIIF